MVESFESQLLPGSEECRIRHCPRSSKANARSNNERPFATRSYHTLAHNPCKNSEKPSLASGLRQTKVSWSSLAEIVQTGGANPLEIGRIRLPSLLNAVGWSTNSHEKGSCLQERSAQKKIHLRLQVICFLSTGQLLLGETHCWLASESSSTGDAYGRTWLARIQSGLSQFIDTSRLDVQSVTVGYC